MQIPFRITFQDMDASPAIESWVREHLANFERFGNRITSFEVVVKAPHKHHQKGKLYRIDLRLGTSQGEIIVNRAGPQDHAHEDVYVALRDAFDAAKRKLRDKEERTQRNRRHPGT